MSTSRGRRIAATFHPVNVRALLVTLLSLAAWGVWGYRHPNPHPWQDLTRGVYTDHFSHLNAARAFVRVGPRIYREGAASIGRDSPSRWSSCPVWRVSSQATESTMPST